MPHADDPSERRCAPERRVCATLDRRRGTLTVTNDEPSPQSARVGVEGLTNAVPRGATEAAVTVAPGASVVAIVLDPLDESRPMLVERWWAQSGASRSEAIQAAAAAAADPRTLPCNAFTDRDVCAVSIPEGDQRARVFLRNTTKAMVTAYFTPKDRDTLIVTIPAGAVVEAATVEPQQWRAHLAVLFGKLDAVPSDEPIELPWDKKARHFLTQAPHGDFSHQDDYAWDFAMDVGTSVRAVRAGVVAFAADSSTIGGGTPAFKEDGNMTLVVHDDGTVALYGHLRFAGAWKSVGERVDAGDLLAVSGNTGFSTGPHLHFQVMRPTRDRRYETLPMFFKTADGVRSLSERGWVTR